MKSINEIKKEMLCVTCGGCKEICPVKAISYEKNNNGLYQPLIDKNKCVNCGLCYKICPSNIEYNIDASNKDEVIKELLLGNILNTYICSTKNENILNNSTSGGFITTTIKYLLDNKLYDCAFLVNKHNYDNLVYSEKITNSDEIELTSKSRYIPVSQSKTINYIINNPNDKVIIVATPCNILTLKKIINTKKLDMDNYLFIGLFCDKTMNYNVIEYFNNHPKVKKHIKNFYFRTKESNAWPGEVGISYDDNTNILLSKIERMKVKDYFCLERCLYCMDKLNSLADISVGDNYTEKKLPYNGSNNIIIRTKKGNTVWENVKSLFYFEECSQEQIVKSQYLNEKYNNLVYLKAKKSENIKCKNIQNVTINKYDLKKYKLLLKKINMGLNQKYKRIYKDTHSYIKKIENKVKNIFIRKKDEVS